MHRSSQTRFVGEGNDHLQLVKFWPSHAPGKGSAAGQKIFGFNLLQPARSVCISLSAFLRQRDANVTVIIIIMKKVFFIIFSLLSATKFIVVPLEVMQSETIG